MSADGLLISALAQVAGVSAAVVAVLGLSLLGVAATRRTPEPEDMTRPAHPLL